MQHLKTKRVNEINLGCIFLKEKRMNFLGSYRPIFCIFYFYMSGSFPDASHKFRIHVSIIVIGQMITKFRKQAETNELI